MIATRSSHSTHGEYDASHQGVQLFTPELPSAIRHFGSGGVVLGSMVQAHNHLQGGYTTGSGSQDVERAVALRQRSIGLSRANVFIPVSHREVTSDFAHALAEDTAFLELFVSPDDLVLFTAKLREYPDLLERTKRLVDAVMPNRHVSAVRIEVDEDDMMVVVWADLDVSDDERLSVQMQLFDEAQEILGSLSDVVLLAMI